MRSLQRRGSFRTAKPLPVDVIPFSRFVLEPRPRDGAPSLGKFRVVVAGAKLFGIGGGEDD